MNASRPENIFRFDEKIETSVPWDRLRGGSGRLGQLTGNLQLRWNPRLSASDMYDIVSSICFGFGMPMYRIKRRTRAWSRCSLGLLSFPLRTQLSFGESLTLQFYFCSSIVKDHSLRSFLRSALSADNSVGCLQTQQRRNDWFAIEKRENTYTNRRNYLRLLSFFALPIWLCK